MDGKNALAFSELIIIKEIYIDIWYLLALELRCNGMPIKLKEAPFVNADGLASNQSINQCEWTSEGGASGAKWGAMIHKHTCVFLCLLAVS